MSASKEPEAKLRPNEALQLTSAEAYGGIAVSAYRVASASVLVGRILSQPLAAELKR